MVTRGAREYSLPLGDTSQLTYYLGRDSFLATSDGRMGHSAESVFAYLSRNTITADRHFGNHGVEIGLQTNL